MNVKLTSIALTCLCVSQARADFNPVALTPSSYTYSIVVPAGTVQDFPDCVNFFTGSGQCFSCDTTFYEQGYYSRIGSQGGNSGLPQHGTVFTDINDPNTSFLMAPDYTTNNDLALVNNPGQSYGTILSGTFTFDTATTATNLAILCTDGNGGMTDDYTVTHSDGSTETGTIAIPDWFSGGPTVAWGANGRIQGNGGYNDYNNSSDNNNSPYLYCNNLTVSGASPIVSITFSYVSGNSVANFYAVSGNASGPNWTPIPLTGYNVTSTVPAAFPVTATMDQGTNIDNVGGGMNTWFEQGFYRQGTNCGVPPSGSVFNSLSQPTHHYQMGNYTNNNATLIDINHLSANITPASPAPYSAFAFLTAGGYIGSGAMTNICILQHQDGVNETNTFFAYDWFNNNLPGAIAWKANGRVDMENRTVNNISNSFPYLFETYFQLNDTTSPVTNILVQYGSAPGNNSTTYILAVSATAGGVPPVISQQPLPATNSWFPSQSASMSVIVSGTAPLTNVWLVESNGVYIPLQDGLDANGSTISGSSTTTLTISGLTFADATNYEYEVSNAFGSETSSNGVVVVESGTPVGPIIDSQIPDSSISSINVFTSVSGKTNAFYVTVDASSSPPLSYQWYSALPQGPSTAIAGATNATYSSVDVGGVTISCIVSNFVGSATSSPVALVATAPSAYQASILAYKPVAYWPLNETGGTVAFDYAGNNNGTYMGGYTLDQPGLPPSAGIGPTASVALDGSTGHVDVPVGKLNITGPLTLIMWIQTSGENGNFTSCLGHSDSSYRFDVDPGGDAHFADAGPDCVYNTSIADDNWHQLVGVYDGHNQYLYVDGKLRSGPNAGTPQGSGDDVYIGGAPDYYPSRSYAGNAAEVVILTNALTTAQVASVYYSLGLPPTVAVSPAGPTVFAGTSLTFVASPNGTPPISLQWYSIDGSGNSNIIAGATSADYSIADVSYAQNGYTFGIIASNAYGQANANTVLTVQNGPPVIPTTGDLSPLIGEAYTGAPVTYTVFPTGTAPFFYQWMVDGIAVSGATNSTFTAPARCGSNTVQAAVTNAFSGGAPTLSSIAVLQGDVYPTNISFNTTGTDWTLNGSVLGFTQNTISNNILELTDGNGGEGSSAFYYTPQYVGSFEASFIYTAGGNASADGASFILQNAPALTNALGASGGGLGFFGIDNSFAFEINLYTGNGEDLGVTADTNGLTYPDGGAQYGSTGAISVNSGHPIQVNLSWANGVLSVLLEDLKKGTTYSTNYTFGSLTPILGGTDLAYIGFGGGDGGATSLQTISNFEFHSVIPPISLTAAPAGSGSITLSWAAGDPNYTLEQTSSLTGPWVEGPQPTLVGNTYQVTIPTAGTQMFYRLVRTACQD